LDIIYRYYQPGDEEGIIKLLNHSFKGWPKLDVDPMGYWKWKYVDNPYWMNDIALALAGDEIIGCKHSVYFQTKLGEEILFCTLGSDMAVHNEYRERGISNELRTLSSKRKQDYGYDLSYLVSSNPIVIASYKDKNPSLPYDIIVYVLIKDIDKQLEKMPLKNPLAKKAAYRGAYTLNLVKRALSKREAPHVKISRVESFDERIGKFWAETAIKYNFIVNRDQKYLNWRYADKRAGQYEIHLAEENNEVTGYCVSYINRYRGEYPVGFIVDLLCHPYQTDLMYALLTKSLEYFNDNDVNIITALALRGSSLEEALGRVGFLNSTEKLNMFFSVKARRVDAQEVIRKSTPETIHFCYGDIDSLPTDIRGENIR
jgi:hypothetical protein